ncbi:MAG: hypothetical protein AB8B53_05190 [Flavobacteriales bacterium]
MSKLIQLITHGSLSKKSLWLVTIVYLALALNFANWNHNKLIRSDTILYYQYLTAAFQFDDMSFQFHNQLPEDFDGEIWVTVTEEGIHNKVTMGMAILLVPFYLMAYAINMIFDLGSYGYSNVFQFFLFIAGVFYGLMGLIVVRKVLLKLFSESAVAVTLLIVGLGTNLTYYSALCPGMTHVYSFFLFAMVLWLTVRWFEKVSLKNTLGLGMILGLICLVRPSNALVVLLPILYGVTTHSSLKHGVSWYLGRFPYYLLMAGGTFMVVSLQLIFWKYSTGSWLVYSYGDEGFFWSDPKILDGLFGARKGWLFYTPLMSLSLLGLLVRKKESRHFTFAIALFFLVNLYVIVSWWCWWYGGGFGMRPLIESYALLAVPLAVAVSTLLRIRLIKWITLPLIIAFLYLNLFQCWQYEKGLIHYDGMNLESYKKLFLQRHNPKDIYDYIESPDYNEAKKGNR